MHPVHWASLYNTYVCTSGYITTLVTSNSILCVGSALEERVKQGEVSGVTYKVLCTLQLLGLAVKGPWLALGESILALAA